jgi:peroxiredoxin Q/BCP
MAWRGLLSQLRAGLMGGGTSTPELRTGAAAPAFALPDQQGRVHRLADYQGRWLVLYFYPRDATPGCTKEACGFRDGYPLLQRLQVALLGVSTDHPASHQAFADRYRLPFPLLADVDGQVSQAYGTLFRLGPLRFSRRHSFIIDPEGRMARIYRAVSPGGHSAAVVRDLRALGVGEQAP